MTFNHVLYDKGETSKELLQFKSTCQIKWMIVGPPNPDSRLAQRTPTVVRARAIRVDVNKSVGILQKSGRV